MCLFNKQIFTIVTFKPTLIIELIPLKDVEILHVIGLSKYKMSKRNNSNNFFFMYTLSFLFSFYQIYTTF